MRTILLAPFALLAACVTSARSDSGPISIGETQRLGDLRVTPIAIREDSRCPMNARCVWAGRVIVRAAITGNGERLERDFTLGEPAPVGAQSIMLDSVTPERMGGEAAAPPAPYRVRFSLVR